MVKLLSGLTLCLAAAHTVAYAGAEASGLGPVRVHFSVAFPAASFAGNLV